MALDSKAYLHALVPSPRFSCHKGMCHFRGFELSTSALDYVLVAQRLCMGLARDLGKYYIIQTPLHCGTWPQFPRKVPRPISPGAGTGLGFFSLATRLKGK